MANPSHLEAIDPVIVGRVRAEQVEKKDARRTCRNDIELCNLKLSVSSLQTVRDR